MKRRRLEEDEKEREIDREKAEEAILALGMINMITQASHVM